MSGLGILLCEWNGSKSGVYLRLPVVGMESIQRFRVEDIVFGQKYPQLPNPKNTGRHQELLQGRAGQLLHGWSPAGWGRRTSDKHAWPSSVSHPAVITGEITQRHVCVSMRGYIHTHAHKHTHFLCNVVHVFIWFLSPIFLKNIQIIPRKLRLLGLSKR